MRCILLLTRLRVEHSDLRAHRFEKHFNCPDPVCACGLENETVEHYLLRCPLFNGPRSVLLEKMNDIFQTNVLSNIDNLSNILLYGDPKNKMILSASIHFIKSSKRFKTLEAFMHENESISS